MERMSVAVKHRIILSFGVSFVIDIAIANDFFFDVFLSTFKRIHKGAEHCHNTSDH